MKLKLFNASLFIVLVSCYACRKDISVAEQYPVKAEVMGVNSDCGIYQIKITDGQDKVESVVGSSVGTNIYIAKNLPEDLKVSGLKISLDLRKPVAANNELGVCLTQGPGYAWLFVTKAKKE
ncbi:MAG: hypothetical protein EOO96_31805 [Pedobacter sp.]|nr:MAG: hypothetical protein EOO96_31805 [Pedobacter sp.]